MLITEAERAATPPNFDYDTFDLPEAANLEFRLNNHANVQDLPPEEELRDVARTSDVIVLESVTADGDNRWLRKISSGDPKEYQRVRDQMLHPTNVEFGRWLWAVMGALYGSRTPAITVDALLTHSCVRRYQKLHDELLAKEKKARTNEDIQELREPLAQQMEAVKERDQIILERLAPSIGQLAVTNKLVRLKQQDRPLKVSLFYGSAHRSLFDAVMHKSSLVPTEDFSASLHGSNDTASVHESVYAQYLRGIEWSDTLLYRYFAQNMIGARIATHGHAPSTITMSQLHELSATLLEGKDYTEARKLADDLARIEGQYKPFVIGG